MRCDEVQPHLEGIASGDVPAEALASHVASCPACAGRVARAQAIDQALQARVTPVPPARFTTDVMARIRRERWRAEQVLDAGFNVAVLAGALLVVAGLAGLFWLSGLVAVGRDLGSLASAAGVVLARRLAGDLQMVMLALVFMTTALAAWWWSENGEVF
jgi:anti-sigma factor RsiW